MEGKAHITLAGVSHPLLFGYTSFKMVMGAKNRWLLFDDNGVPTEVGIGKIVYSGYVNYLDDRDIEAMPFSEFAPLFDAELISEGGADRVAKIMKVWSESQYVQDLVKETKEKKSLTTETEGLTSH